MVAHSFLRLRYIIARASVGGQLVAHANGVNENFQAH